MNFNRAQIQYLLAIDRFRSIMKASEHCHISQPSLSMQLKNIEESLGLILFDRTKQPLKVTEAGQRILDQAKQVLSEMEKIESIAQEEKGKIEGSLSIGIIPTLAPYLLPLFAGEFIIKYPDVEIRIHEDFTENICQQISLGNLDVGILVTPVRVEGIEERPIFYEEFYAYAGKDIHEKHPSNTISLQSLLINHIWLLEEGNCFRNQTFNLCGSNMIKEKYNNLKYQSGSLQTLINMVDVQGGFTLIPQLASNYLSENQAERLKFIDDKKAVREVSVIHPKRFAKTNLIEKLIKEIEIGVPDELMANKAQNLIEIY
ncbi:MAG: LysR substrate-binding domain-containing protein [Bacteroidota bacterium]